MFRKQLEADARAIFGVKKTTFLAVDPASPEQDCLFIEAHSVSTRAHGKDRFSGIVKGALVMFSQEGRLPYGFFGKAIEKAPQSITKSFFFEQENDVSAKSLTGVTTTSASIQNLHERRVGFTYLFDTQYDPDRGEMNELDLSLEMEE